MRSLPVRNLQRLRARALTPIWVAALAFSCVPGAAQERPTRILYFTHSAGYRHDVIPVSREILKRIGETAPPFEVMASEDVSVFTYAASAR
jgi:uncharacterized protein